MIKHREIFFEINSKQSAELKSGTTKVKNYSKQTVAPINICVDTECNLEKIHINDRKKTTLQTLHISKSNSL